MSFVVESKHLTEPDDNGTQTLTLKLGPVDIDSNNEQDYKTAAKELYSLYSAFIFKRLVRIFLFFSNTIFEHI